MTWRQPKEVFILGSFEAQSSATAPWYLGAAHHCRCLFASHRLSLNYHSPSTVHPILSVSTCAWYMFLLVRIILGLLTSQSPIYLRCLLGRATRPHKNLYWLVRLILLVALIYKSLSPTFLQLPRAPQITWSYNLQLESTFAVGLFIIMWVLVLGASSVGKQPYYFERNFSNSEKALKLDGFHGPVVGRCGIKEKQNHREWVECWQ